LGNSKNQTPAVLLFEHTRHTHKTMKISHYIST